MQIGSRTCIVSEVTLRAPSQTVTDASGSEMTFRTGLDELLEELTISQLRDLYASLSGSPESPGRRKQEVIASVVAAAEPEKVQLQAHRLETLNPFKHCFLYRLSPGSEDSPRDMMDKWSDACWSELEGKVATDTADDDDELKPQLQIYDHFSQTIHVKFVHAVYSERWEQTTPTTKELRSETIRHPVVASLRAADNTMAIRFPGFTQGGATPMEARVDYQELASKTAAIIDDRISGGATPLALRKAVEGLLRSSGDVSDVRRVIRPQTGGRMEIDSGELGEPTPVPRYLADFFQVESSAVRSLEREIRSVIEKSPADSILLAWHKPRIFTRITFHAGPSELYFLWKSGDKSLESVEYVVKQLTAEAQLAENVDADTALAYLNSISRGSVVRPTDLMQHFSISAEDAFRVLHEATAQGMLHRCYRVNTERRLEDFQNSWRQKLTDFPSVVTTEDGTEISVEDPRNIEIGFERVTTDHE